MSKADARYAKVARIRIVLGLLGEIKNYWGYMDGSMGELTKEQEVNVTDRLTNVLAAANKEGIDVTYFLELAIEKGPEYFPALEYVRLVQLCTIAEMNWKMRLALGPEKWEVAKNFTKAELEHIVGCYTDACRNLRKRYYLVKLDKLLPALNFSGPYSQ